MVTDVGSVKGPVAAAVDDPRFVGGHPMAGSEQEGVDGANAGLFEGATWVLTPTLDTDPQVFARIRSVVTSLGADVVALPPERHDELVALVSQVTGRLVVGGDVVHDLRDEVVAGAEVASLDDLAGQNGRTARPG